MGRRNQLCKEADYITRLWCAGGVGILREEVWADEKGVVVRYNLAFILPHLSSVDHGRILGFDNAHGIHERHFMGKVQVVQFRDYQATANRFYREVESIRRKL